MSKGMEALRRSKASAGEAPNLPPHGRPDVFLPASLTIVEFSGAWPAAPASTFRWQPIRRTDFGSIYSEKSGSRSAGRDRAALRRRATGSRLSAFGSFGLTQESRRRRKAPTTADTEPSLWLAP